MTVILFIKTIFRFSRSLSLFLAFSFFLVLQVLLDLAHKICKLRCDPHINHYMHYMICVDHKHAEGAAETYNRGRCRDKKEDTNKKHKKVMTVILSLLSNPFLGCFLSLSLSFLLSISFRSCNFCLTWRVKSVSCAASRASIITCII